MKTISILLTVLLSLVVVNMTAQSYLNNEEAFARTRTLPTQSQVTIFDNVSLEPGQKISSVVNLEDYSGVSIFLSSGNKSFEGGWEVKAKCSYLPLGADPNDRYSGTFLELITNKDFPQQMTSDLYMTSPKMVCDIQTNRLWVLRLLFMFTCFKAEDPNSIVPRWRLCRHLVPKNKHILLIINLTF